VNGEFLAFALGGFVALAGVMSLTLASRPDGATSGTTVAVALLLWLAFLGIAAIVLAIVE
jgi:hypothetical protein